MAQPPPPPPPGSRSELETYGYRSASGTMHGEEAKRAAAPLGASSPEPRVPPSNAEGLFSIANLLVFLFSEGIGVPLAIAGGDAAANELWRPAVVGFGFGLPLMALGFVFPFVKHRLSLPSRDRVERVAMFCAPAVILAAFVYVVGPDIYRRATRPDVRMEPQETEQGSRRKAIDVAEMPTKLRVLFKHTGKPEEVAAENLTWTWMLPDEYMKNPAYNAVPSSSSSLGLGPQLLQLLPSAPEYTGITTWMVIMVFDHPIIYKSIKIDDHGANLPAPDIWRREEYAIVWFHADIGNALIDFTFSDSAQ